MDNARNDTRSCQKVRKCSACGERDLLTSVANGYARLCRHCLTDSALLARLDSAAIAAGFQPHDQIPLF
jgi:ribosomal protein S14